MNDDDPQAPPPALPHPVAPRRPHLSLWLIWLLPVSAVAIGIGLGLRALAARGPVVSILFRSGEGLEAGKTHLKFKDVDVGVVRSVRLTPDQRDVEVRAELTPGPTADALRRRDTRYWVVRPRVGLGGISGLGTLLSGAYIGVEAGRDDTPSDEFRGLDVQPPIAGDLKGRQFVLESDTLGSLDIGSPVYYRRVPVGQVGSYALRPDGRGVHLTVFVQAPYDRFVTPRSRFWHASGVDVALDAQGVRVDLQSIASVLSGGVSFEDVAPDDPSAAAPAPAADGAGFRLYDRRDDAMKRPDGPGFDYRLLVRGSVRGLVVGSPVDYRGLSIGEVTRIGVEGTAGADNPMPRIAVDIRVHPGRLPTVHGRALPEDDPRGQVARLDPMVAHGFRAQLRPGNLLTGQLYVALDFFPDAPTARVDWRSSPPTLPTVPAAFDDLQASLVRIAHKLDALPLDTLAADLHRDLGTLHDDLRRADTLMTHVDQDLAPEAKQLMQDARSTMGDLRQVLGTADRTLSTSAVQALGDVQRAARSLRALADYLEQHPETLVRGKPEDAK